METQKFLSSGGDTNFVQAIEELMGSLPDKVACRISNYNKNSSEVESSHFPKDKACSEEIKSTQCTNNDGKINGLVTKSRIPAKVEKKAKDNSHVSKKGKATQEHIIGNEPIQSKPLITDTHYVLSDVIPPHQSKDFSFRPINSNDNSLERMVDVNGCVKDILGTSLEFRHVSNRNGDLLIADALIEVEGDLGDNYNITHEKLGDSIVSGKSILKEISSRHVKFTNLPNVHVGNGDGHIVPIQQPNKYEDKMNGELKDARINNFNVVSKDRELYPTINFPSVNENPIKIHWALTRIACYKDAYTYEVMRPFKKAPRKLPHDTDKVFIVLKGNEK
ncbi:hypothetical protein LSTR_LSTR006241 [Laodelphax striatellus]|uniref:Uncharacterized protein n=1 Tax=Laodelphax striatellus TaxID=195883 RepID=A0A482XRG6_LAOST|nr:hypothetical protein LSTR_LSTR006241 [Laodelphax striatellus]